MKYSIPSDSRKTLPGNFKQLLWVDLFVGIRKKTVRYMGKKVDSSIHNNILENLLDQFRNRSTRWDIGYKWD